MNHFVNTLSMLFTTDGCHMGDLGLLLRVIEKAVAKKEWDMENMK